MRVQQVVRIDALSRGSVTHKIVERFCDEPERRLEGKLGRAQGTVKALQEEYRDAHDAAQHRLRTDDLLSLLPRIERFVADYERQRRTGGEADFDDLLFWAAELLRTSKRRATTSAAATRWC